MKKVVLILLGCVLSNGWALDPFFGDSTQVISERPQVPIEIWAKMVFIEQASAKDIGARLGVKSSSDDAGLQMVPLMINHWQGLSLHLSLLEKQGRAKLIASPHLQTLSGQTAIIESGEEVPYQQVSKEGGTGTAFKKAVLSLKVNPTLLKKNGIKLDISVSQDQVSSLMVQGVPRIRTQKLSTKVLLKNGQTVMLGGIYEDKQNTSWLGMPGLSKVPFLGWLFKSRQEDNNRKELLVFIRAQART